jgi:hypothetical protein
MKTAPGKPSIMHMSAVSRKANGVPSPRRISHAGRTVIMLVISKIQFFLNAPGMEPFFPLMVNRIDALNTLVNDA